MKTLLFAAMLLVGTAACGPRKVEVVSGPQAATEVSLSVTNNLKQPVNIYVLTGGKELFIKQVGANTTERMNVPNVAAGTTVKLKATPVDGSNSYTRDDVTLSGLYEWQVP